MHINDMTDEQLGAWFRRALVDLCSGCIDPKTDPLVKDIYKHSHERMIKAQNHNHQMYSNRIAKINDQETKISTNEYCSDHPETDALDSTTNLPEVDSESGTIKSDKKAYGQNKNVMLTDEEGAHLRELYGEDLKMAIDILDAYIENGGKKAKRYKDHAAVMRRGNWVWNKVQETRLVEKRLENANRPANVKSFKQADRDERTRFFMDTSVVDRMIENESKAI
jgi:hypothetical protein